VAQNIGKVTSIPAQEKPPEPEYAKVTNGANFQDKTININETCSALPTYPTEGSTITMIDTRNNKPYTVRKLKDGNCWMIDNLALELTDGMILTPATTNIDSDKTVTLASGGRITNSSFTTSGHLTIDGTDAYNYGDVNGANYNAWRQVDPGNSSTAARPPLNCDPQGTKINCGYLYNFYTATASTADNTKTSGNADYSICPAGWKLPSGRNANGDYGILDLAYSPQGTGAKHENDVIAQGLWLPAGAWQGAYSGIYIDYPNYGLFSQGSIGHYWSSSVYLWAAAYTAEFSSGGVYPGNDFTRARDSGLTIRCLVG
jgi:uncharacterized protein (TIGR02145 family)